MTSVINIIGNSAKYIYHNFTPFGSKSKHLPSVPDRLREISRKYLVPLIAVSRLDPVRFNSSFFTTTMAFYSVVALECMARFVEHVYPERITHTQYFTTFNSSFTAGLIKIREKPFFLEYCKDKELMKDGHPDLIKVSRIFRRMVSYGGCSGGTLAVLKQLIRDPSQSNAQIFTMLSMNDYFYLHFVDSLVGGFYRPSITGIQNLNELSLASTPSEIPEDPGLKKIIETQFSQVFAKRNITTDKEKAKFVSKQKIHEIVATEFSDDVINDYKKNHLDTVLIPYLQQSFSSQDKEKSISTFILERMEAFSPFRLAEGYEEFVKEASNYKQKNFASVQDFMTHLRLNHSKFISSWHMNCFKKSLNKHLIAHTIEILSLNFEKKEREGFVKSFSETKKIVGKIAEQVRAKKIEQTKAIEVEVAREVGALPTTKFQIQANLPKQKLKENILNLLQRNIDCQSHRDVVCTFRWPLLLEIDDKVFKFPAMGYHMNLSQLTGHIRSYDNSDKIRDYNKIEEMVSELVDRAYDAGLNPEELIEISLYLIPKKK